MIFNKLIFKSYGHLADKLLLSGSEGGRFMSQEAVRAMTPDERAKREGAIVCKALFTILNDLDLSVEELRRML